jgi:dihydrofolate reductase
MRRITVVEHVSLDGVFQAPGGPDEDTSGGFDRGGWGHAYNDEVLGRKMAESMSGGPGAMLFGRRTYEQFFSYWPHQHGNPYSEALNAMEKFVVTTRPDEPLPWQNSTAVHPADLRALRDGDGPNLTVLGSGQVVAALREQGLVDRYLLTVCPIVLGKGKRLFGEGAEQELRLVEGLPTTTGAVIATYEVVR